VTGQVDDVTYSCMKRGDFCCNCWIEEICCFFELLTYYRR